MSKGAAPPAGPHGPMPNLPFLRAPWQMRVSDSEREQALTPVQEAYAAGRLEDAEFQQRLSAVLHADTRAALLPLLSDLPDAYSNRAEVGSGPGAGPGPSSTGPTPATFASPAAAGRTPRPVDAQPSGRERCWAVSAHALGFCTSFVGPLLLSRGAEARRSGYVRGQALTAADFQATALVVLVATVLSAAVSGPGALLVVPLTFAWLVLTGVGAARAVDGLEFRHRWALPFFTR